MNRLVLLAATLVLSTCVMVGQKSPAATDESQSNAAPGQMQRGTAATPPMVPHQPPDTIANPDRNGTTPETTLPNTTVDDQQPGNSTTGSPASTMGTTGSTPATEQSPDGNKSGTTPNHTQTPDTNSTQPHQAYPSGSSSPNSSANGASSDDMSGTNPKPDTKPDNSTNSTNPPTTPQHIATHAPDAGTEMNPASLETVTAVTDQH
ncbi:MAG: hypothetical protein WAM71_07635 [Candidatus Korobacteraceae bacterium]